MIQMIPNQRPNNVMHGTSGRALILFLLSAMLALPSSSSAQASMCCCTDTTSGSCLVSSSDSDPPQVFIDQCEEGSLSFALEETYSTDGTCSGNESDDCDAICASKRGACCVFLSSDPDVYQCNDDQPPGGSVVCQPDAGDVYGGDDSTCGAGDASEFDTLQECADSITAPLPVELIAFNALTDGDQVVLIWATASEAANAGFSVEQEVGTHLYTEIGFVRGSGTTLVPQEYKFTVTDLDPGRHRFRLKQIDFDGAFEYSSVVEAVVLVPDRFLIESAYPNPFNPTTTLRFAVAVEQHVDVTLLNVAGQAIETLYSATAAANDMHTLTVDARDLPSGTYVVHFNGDGLSATERIVLAK